MTNARVVGYVADAGVYCTWCAPPLWAKDEAQDASGNPVHPIFENDEERGKDNCDACHEPLAVPAKGP